MSAGNKRIKLKIEPLIFQWFRNKDSEYSNEMGSVTDNIEICFKKKLT